MVLLKLLGSIDLLMALMVCLASFGIEPTKIYVMIALLHGIKAMIFIRDIFSLLDLAIVLYTFIIPFHNIPLLSLLIIVFLSYKGSYSMT